MTDSYPNVFKVKNQWLFDQVEVEFPTPESLKGRAIYKSLCEDKLVTLLTNNSAQESDINLDDIYLVDFHRLTVMFSLLQASRGRDEQEQNYLLEFFTQIIFSEPCYLYVGFKQSEPVAAALITESENELLVSDVVIKDLAYSSADLFAQAVIQKWLISHDFSGSFYIEQ
ncbi:hypothetical protein [Vibrio diazotrophicus]|uniref:hypothetical protein n=1 Tax=Vibrio diazotrophicus TaxID=685 RepID=UPI00142DAC9A|nr:hypothetical protein [Vibrio diazotrophicus]NIY91969.1 hypothetical protein [Vibrio diazotrophicus]